ncbi:T9SS type B sorting domain-containing protein [Christiangramia sabulilitoris]|nr:T9SS type B sorting domain-containing protein [Christiangramia sabulilitoris]
MLISIFGMLAVNSSFAQGALCSDIEPFCAGDERLTFPNSNFTNSTQIRGEPGPNYGCLEEQPYPAWFFLQVEDSGNLNFRISQYENSNNTGAPLDVDFVVWGPFARGDEFCDGTSLSFEKIVDCSYLPDAIESMTIPGALANEIYVVVITNFEQIPGFISLEQVNNSGGSTDCSILDLDLGDNIAVCDESQYVIDGSTAEASKYEWFVFNENTSAYDLIPGERGPTLTVTVSGNYKLIVTDEVENKTEEDDVNVTFYQSPLVGEVSNLSVCSVEAEIVDLTEKFEELIAPNNGNSSDYEVLYYAGEDDLAEGVNIDQPFNYPFQEGAIIYAEVINRESGCKSPAEDFELSVFDFPDFELEETTIFCVDLDMNLIGSVSLGDDLGDGYFYEWKDGEVTVGTEAIISFDQLPEASEISVVISHPASGCELEFITNPVAVSRPEEVLFEVSGSDFGDGYSVLVKPEGAIGEENAAFEYRLDNGSWQADNNFRNVPPGSHTVSAREVNGCGMTTSESFFLVGYPRFFTPNADGFNDNWNLITDSNISIQNLYVFDRYGKLIVKLNPSSRGWDGTFNGSDLPADDYWFRVEFIDEKTGIYREYMSNFSLVR